MTPLGMDTSRVIGLAAASAADRSDPWSTVINTLQLATAVEVGVFEGAFARHILAQCPTVSSDYMLDPWRHLDNWNKPGQ